MYIVSVRISHALYILQVYNYQWYISLFITQSIISSKHSLA